MSDKKIQFAPKNAQKLAEIELWPKADVLLAQRGRVIATAVRRGLTDDTARQIAGMDPALRQASLVTKPPDA